MLYDLINICLKYIQNMGQLAFQNIILIYFKMKNILKNNRNHTPSKKKLFKAVYSRRWMECGTM